MAQIIQGDPRNLGPLFFCAPVRAAHGRGARHAHAFRKCRERRCLQKVARWGASAAQSRVCLAAEPKRRHDSKWSRLASRDADHHLGLRAKLPNSAEWQWPMLSPNLSPNEWNLRWRLSGGLPLPKPPNTTDVIVVRSLERSILWSLACCWPC